jgi:hypothetical protein
MCAVPTITADAPPSTWAPHVELTPGEVLHQFDPVAVVAIEHEHRQQAVDVRTDGVRAAEVEALGMRLL